MRRLVYDRKIIHYDEWRSRRAGELAGLREAVENSHYEVDSRAVAECMLFEHICALLD